MLEQSIQYLDSFLLRTAQICGISLIPECLSVSLPAFFLSGSETQLCIYGCSSLGNLGFSSSYTCTAQAPPNMSSAFLAIGFFWKAHTFFHEVDVVPADKLHWQETRSTHFSLLQTNHNCSVCFILSPSQEWNT